MTYLLSPLNLPEAFPAHVSGDQDENSLSWEKLGSKRLRVRVEILYTTSLMRVVVRI